MRRLLCPRSSYSFSSTSLLCLVSLPVPLPVRSICQRHVTAWAALNCVSKDFFSFLFSPLSPFVSPPPPPTLSSSIARVCLFVYSACCLLPFSASFASGGRRQRRRRRGRQRDSLTDGPGKWGKPFCVFRLSTIFSWMEGGACCCCCCCSIMPNANWPRPHCKTLAAPCSNRPGSLGRQALESSSTCHTGCCPHRATQCK